MKRALAIFFCFAMFCSIAAAAPGDLKIIKAAGAENVKQAPLKTLSIQEAITRSADTPRLSNLSSENTSSAPPVQQSEKIESSSVGSNMVSAGIDHFGRSTIDGMYASFDNNSAVNSKFGKTRGAIFTVITFVPNPYAEPAIKALFQNYNLLAIFFVIIFIFGEWANRNLARTKLTADVFGRKDITQARFFGGLCMCMIALSANLIFMFSLQIIQALSQFAMSNVLDSLAPSPDNLMLYAMMAFCDLVVVVFFMIRYFIIYAIAVICTVLAVLLVPEFSRDFAKKSIDNVIRILLLQPVTIFFTALGIIALKGLPPGTEPVGYIGLTILIFLICWYMLFGDFEFIKKGISYAVKAGAV